MLRDVFLIYLQPVENHWVEVATVVVLDLCDNVLCISYYMIAFAKIYTMKCHI